MSLLINASTVHPTKDLWKGNGYLACSEPQQQIASDVIRLTLQKFSSNSLFSKRVLDVGCGDGRISDQLTREYYGCHVQGVDRSESMIRCANQSIQNHSVSFRIDDAEQLNTVEDSTIDSIFSFCCLHWIKNHEAVFETFKRVLKDDGWISLVFAANTNATDCLTSSIGEILQSSQWHAYIKEVPKVDWNFSDAGTIEQQLQKLDFKEIKVEEVKVEYIFPSVNEFKIWLKDSLQQLKAIPENLQDQCLSEIAQVFLKNTKHRQKNEGFTVFIENLLHVTAKI